MIDDSKRWDLDFPIFWSEDYDLNFFHHDHSIGLMSTMPEDLVRRIMAAALSYHMRLKSIDYTYKQYLGDKSYPVSDGNRVDIKVSKVLRAECNHFNSLVHYISGVGEKNVGNVICEWTLMRVPHSICQLLALAHRGNLYECCCIGRMVLEQVAWSMEIDGVSDAEVIKNVKAEGSVRVLKGLFPFAGRLYGWLSSHTHWRYDGHIKAMRITEDGTFTTLRSARFKAISLAIGLILLLLAIRLLTTIRGNYIAELGRLDPSHRIERRTQAEVQTDLLGMYSGESSSTIAEISNLLTMKQCLDATNDIRNVSAADRDIALLCDMAAQCAR